MADASSSVNLRECTPADIDYVIRFVESCAPLEVHTSFTYWVTFEYWGHLCRVALVGNRVVGYVSAIGSGRVRDVLYVWQVGVAQEFRGQGLAQRLLSEVVTAGRANGFRKAQVSIAGDNEASLKAFERFAREQKQRLERCGEVLLTGLDGKSTQENLYTFDLL